LEIPALLKEKMKSHSPFALTVALILSFYSANAQTSTGLETRPRTVSQTQQPQQQVPASTNKAEIQPLGNPSDVRVNTSGASVTTLAPVPVEERAPQLPTSFSPSTIRSRIAEAERLMKTRPQPTALTSPSIEFVTIAALDRATSRIHLFTVSKETFLKKNADLSLISSQA